MVRYINKGLVGPIIYWKGSDYNAKNYWQDRFSKYGMSLKGVGNDNLSERENLGQYTEDLRVFEKTCQSLKLNLKEANILDIGCGNGYWCDFFFKNSVKSYVGLDITDKLFVALRKAYIGFRFIKRDISIGKLPANKFDLVVMIEVAGHIVTKKKLSSAFDSIKKSLRPGGIFIIGRVSNKGGRRLFYLRFWSQSDIVARLSGFHIVSSVPFRNARLIAFEKDSRK